MTRVAGLVSLRSSLLYKGFMVSVLLCLSLTMARAASETKVSTSPEEPLRLEIFKEKPTAKICQLFARSEKTWPKDKAIEVKELLDKLVAGLKQKNPATLIPLFHPRLNVNQTKVDELFASMERSYRSPFDISLYRVWALNTLDDSAKGISCAEDGITIYPMYGYKIQFAAWLQVMGQNELGRIYVDLVPKDGKWFIGAYHSQQWTHQKRDVELWLNEARSDAKAKLLPLAFIKYDLVVKLLENNPYIDIDQAAEAEKERDQTLRKEIWEAEVRKLLKDYNVIFLNTILAKDGTGILVRLEVPGEVALTKIRDDCNAIAGIFKNQPWGKALGGVKCSYVMKGEDPSKEGQLGGIYVSLGESR